MSLEDEQCGNRNGWCWNLGEMGWVSDGERAVDHPGRAGHKT